RRGNEHPRFSQAARRHDHSGAAAQIQAVQHGRLAALHHPAPAVSSDAVAAAVSVHAGARRLGAALRAHLGIQLEHAELSSGHWYFNPFAWQLLFVFGAWCALGGAQRLATVLRSPVTVSIAIAY